MEEEMKEIKWIKYEPEIGPVYYQGYVGKWTVFYIQCTMTKDALGDYILINRLPGLAKHDRQISIEVAKETAQSLLEYWLKAAGLWREK